MSLPRNIAFIAGTLGQGGSERQLFYILSALRQRQVAVRLLCLTEHEFWGDRIRNLGVPVCCVGQSGSRLVRLWRIVSELRKDCPAVVQSQHFYTNLYAGLSACVLGLRGVGAVRSDVLSEVRNNGRLFGNLSLRLPRVLVANSRAALSNLERLRVGRSRVRYLQNVVDTEHFKPTPRGARREAVHLLAIGRLVEEKRLDCFLRVVARVRDSARIRLHAVIVGDGPLHSRLEQQARDLGLLPGVVEFRGGVEDPASAYREADVLALTSGHEGTPNVVLEAMASGLPVVCFSVGDVPELVRNGITGFSLAPENEDGMADALLKLVSDPQLRIEVGMRARDFVVANHRLELLPKLLDDLYHSMLA